MLCIVYGVVVYQTICVIYIVNMTRNNDDDDNEDPRVTEESLVFILCSLLLHTFVLILTCIACTEQ